MGRDPSYGVNYYCAAGGRIPGAVKMATIWLIPKERGESLIDVKDKTRKGIKT